MRSHKTLGAAIYAHRQFHGPCGKKLGKGYGWVDKLLAKPMARRDAWVSMFCQLYPAMKWGMVAVIMPVKKLEEKVGKLYYKMLPPLGVNRNIGKG